MLCVNRVSLCSSASTAESKNWRNASAPRVKQKIGRVETIGQRDNSQIDLLGHKQAKNFIRPALAGFVAIEHQRDRIGKPPQQANMPLTQRRAQHRHGVLETELPGDDRVGVAFHHHHLPATADRRRGPNRARTACCFWRTAASPAS